MKVSEKNAELIGWAIDPMEEEACNPDSELGYTEDQLPTVRGPVTKKLWELDLESCNVDALEDLIYRLGDQLTNMTNGEPPDHECHAEAAAARRLAHRIQNYLDAKLGDAEPDTNTYSKWTTHRSIR